jgi:hypothetical protein
MIEKEEKKGLRKALGAAIMPINPAFGALLFTGVFKPFGEE